MTPDIRSLYRVWGTMKDRCDDPEAISYPLYGARGITVGHWWQDWPTFRDWALASGYRKGLQLDRIDNDGPYEAWNCQWSTRKKQARNRRDNRAVIRSDGKRFRTMAGAAEKTPGAWSQNISHCCRGILKSTAGFGWRYDDKPRTGPGSGSRLRLFHCACVPPIKLRVARDTLDIQCNCCNTNFLKA